MTVNLNELVEHNDTDDCPVCRALDFTYAVVAPAVASWEQSNEFPKMSLALNGAVALLGAMLEEGVPRNELDKTVAALLDDIEQQITEDGVLGGPTQGTA